MVRFAGNTEVMNSVDESTFGDLDDWNISIGQSEGSSIRSARLSPGSGTISSEER